MTDPLPSPATPDAPRATPGMWLMAVVLFAFTLVLHSRHNDFPFTYHPDEGGKVVQVLVGSRNFHHPLLMLQAATYVSRVAFIPHEPQAIVQTGRWVSAAFAAGSVTALALLAWWNYGLLIGWGAGLAVALQEDLFEMSHYMKEDPALLFGLALALFAAHVWWRRPGRRSLRFLAIACGLAAAGKYLGIVSLLFAVPIVIWHRAPDAFLPSKARLKSFAIVFVVTFLICNFPLFGWKISSPFRSIRNEMDGVAGGHQGLTRKVPHAEYLKSLKGKVPPAEAALVAVYALALLATARRRTPAEWITLLFPLLYLAMISCSPKIAERYLLPVSAMVPLLAALGAGEIGRALSSPNIPVRTMIGHAVAAGLLAWIAYAEWPTFHRSWDGFQHDDPTAVAEWIKAHVPATAIIAEDHRVNLSATKADGLSSAARVPQKVLDASFAPDLGSLDDLRAKGVEYVAVCKQNYGRYFNEEKTPQAVIKSGYDKRRDFYTRVFAEGELLKEWPKGPIAYLQPGIKLYRIAPEKPQP
ncbi:MAG: phospholipid carrier-dependent glycosyltransferase [Chthoniobacter sp.]|nr:phospholipid carrier-dependent glycosyltransferase [Chthoniobacter sp.]